jgi:hypothetical protein
MGDALVFIIIYGYFVAAFWYLTKTRREKDSDGSN